MQAEKLEFNSELARQRTAELLDGWATDYPEAALALKLLAKQVVRSEVLVGWKLFGQEILAMEV